jgi:hypothetical protein
MRPTSLKGDVDETVERPNSSRFEKPSVRERVKTGSPTTLDK